MGKGCELGDAGTDINGFEYVKKRFILFVKRRT